MFYSKIQLRKSISAFVEVHVHSCGSGLPSTFPGWLCVLFSVFMTGRNELELKLVIVCNDA